MKNKIYQLLLVSFVALSFVFTSGVAEAYYSRTYCKWVHGHKICCKWVRGHWRHGHWHPAHKVCWTR